MVLLVAPSLKYKQSFLEALEELRRDTQHPVSEIKEEITDSNFEAYVERLHANAKGEQLPDGYVSMTTWWLVDGDEYIGRVSIRHRLNEYLLRIGGHIGYAIRPSKRNKGFGTKILGLALEKARAMGFDRVLLTCDKTNVGSVKIIVKNGGVLENEIEPGNGLPMKQRYWIELK